MRRLPGDEASRRAGRDQADDDREVEEREAGQHLDAVDARTGRGSGWAERVAADHDEQQADGPDGDGGWWSSSGMGVEWWGFGGGVEYLEW